jgi:hypothetical protein
VMLDGDAADRELTLHGVTFEWVSSITPDTGSDGRVTQFAPQDRYVGSSAPHRYGGGPFCRFALRGNYPFSVGRGSVSRVCAACVGEGAKVCRQPG